MGGRVNGTNKPLKETTPLFFSISCSFLFDVSSCRLNQSLSCQRVLPGLLEYWPKILQGSAIVKYPYNKVKGCLTVLPKDLANRWIDMVLLYMVVLGRFIAILGEGTTTLPTAYRNTNQPKLWTFWIIHNIKILQGSKGIRNRP